LQRRTLRDWKSPVVKAIFNLYELLEFVIDFL